MTTTSQESMSSKWIWKASGQTEAVSKRPMNLKVKATIQAAVMVLIGFLLRHFFPHHISYIIVWSLAGLVLIGGLFYPPLFHGFERFGQWLAKVVSAGLTWGLLVPFYYLCFFPGRLIVAALGKDPMDRKFPTGETTYWIPRPEIRDMEQYKRQH